jgi:hypothetical protein
VNGMVALQIAMLQASQLFKELQPYKRTRTFNICLLVL